MTMSQSWALGNKPYALLVDPQSKYELVCVCGGVPLEIVDSANTRVPSYIGDEALAACFVTYSSHQGVLLFALMLHFARTVNVY